MGSVPFALNVAPEKTHRTRYEPFAELVTMDAPPNIPQRDGERFRGHHERHDGNTLPRTGESRIPTQNSVGEIAKLPKGSGLIPNLSLASSSSHETGNAWLLLRTRFVSSPVLYAFFSSNVMCITCGKLFRLLSSKTRSKF